MKLRRMKWRNLRRMYWGDIEHPVRIEAKVQPTTLTESFMNFFAERLGCHFTVVKFLFPANKEKRLK